MKAGRKKKAALKDRAFSPAAHVLSPNNDRHEKEQARAARMAAHRRTSMAGFDVENATRCRKISFAEDDIFGKEQIMELFQNCIKLATENKINQRNTWDLRLIDHLSEIITDDDKTDIETNFQKASFTLEASVKIYSYRVDSVHSDAYKVLGGVNRTATDDGADKEAGLDEDDGGQDPRGHILGKLTTSATLEPSYDAINAKKFDVAFTVDPLFQQTSGQFDEGGANAFLLNTLSVYNGCTVAFDSSNIPDKSRKGAKTVGQSAVVDLTFVRPDIKQLMMVMQAETDISPTLIDIVSMLEDPYRTAAAIEQRTNAATVDQISAEKLIEFGERFDFFEENSEDCLQNGVESYGGISPSSVSWASSGRGDEVEDSMASIGTIDVEDNVEMSGAQIMDWIAAGLCLSSKLNAWAGPEHWKYRKGNQHSTRCAEPHGRKMKNNKTELFSIDFLNPPPVHMTDFAPVPNKKSLLLSQSRLAVTTVLPEDCHYEAENLMRLYLHPPIMCSQGRSSRKQTEYLKHGGNNVDGTSSGLQWNEDNDCTDSFGSSVWEEPNVACETLNIADDCLIPHPAKVQRTEVKYDKVSKQVDVRVLKEILWQRLCEKQTVNQVREEQVSFQDLFRSLQVESALSTFKDISVHLCFICLLHLANEHSLLLQGCSDLNEIQI